MRGNVGSCILGTFVTKLSHTSRVHIREILKLFCLKWSKLLLVIDAVKLQKCQQIRELKLDSRQQQQSFWWSSDSREDKKFRFYKLSKSWARTTSTLCLPVDRVLLAEDQQYGFPVNASQRASVTLTPLHSTPSDSTPCSESGPVKCLISQPDWSFYFPPVCLPVAVGHSVNAWMIFFIFVSELQKTLHSNSLIYSTACLYKQFPTPFLPSQLSLVHFSFTTIISQMFAVFLFLMVLVFLFFFLYHFDSVSVCTLSHCSSPFSLSLSFSLYLLFSLSSHGKGPAVCAQKPSNCWLPLVWLR